MRMGRLHERQRVAVDVQGVQDAVFVAEHVGDVGQRRCSALPPQDAQQVLIDALQVRIVVERLGKRMGGGAYEHVCEKVM
jgi:hypothetical protein